MHTSRVVLLGDGGVGKTALAVQYTLGGFFDDINPAIEEVYRKLQIVDNKTFLIDVFDLGTGQEGYPTPHGGWARPVRKGQGFVLVYSISSRSTFERINVYREFMREVKQGEPVCILVGSKCDRTHEREVTQEEGAALAREFGCEFIETSAKTGQNVERLFVNVIRRLRQETAMRRNKCVVM